MSVQAATIIQDALGLLGVVDPVEAMDPEDAALGLRVLNRRVSLANADSLLLVALTHQSANLTSGDGTVTVGTAGDIAIERPNRIELGAYVRSNGTDYPLTQLNREQFASLASKSQTGLPKYVNYESGTAVLGTLKFWPVPDATYTAHIPIKSKLGAFAATTTSVDLADGVEEYLVTSLAIDLGPMYQRDVHPSVVARQRAAKTLIKRLTWQAAQLETQELQALSRPAGISLSDFINGTI